MRSGGHRWAYARETLFALAVIALTFLNFGHVSVSASGAVQVTPDSWCGSPLAPEGAPHAPCHACRTDGAALPPPPVAVAAVSYVFSPVFYTKQIDAPAPRLTASPIQPRGPPAPV